MSADDLAQTLRALPDSWRRSAVASMLRHARGHAEDGEREQAAFWHALAVLIDDAIREDKETFEALTAGLDPAAGIKGEILSPDTPRG